MCDVAAVGYHTHGHVKEANGCESAKEYIAGWFEIEESVEQPKGWICPTCGVDRGKEVCPQGLTGSVTGSCPMFGVAHGVAK